MPTSLTAEMLADMPMPSEARISPDGQHVIFALAPGSKREEHPVSAIWLTATNNAHSLRQLSAGTANDTRPRWSPDGREIAFLSDRSKRGTAQVYILSLDGGEAQPLTDEAGGISDLCWLPGDVRRIACLAVDARDEDQQRRRDEERDDANVYGEFWPRAQLVLHDLDSGATQRFDSDGMHIASMTPSPDGSRLAITLWDTPEIDSVMANSQLALLDLASGDVTPVAQRGFNADSITWSADGKALYFFAQGGQAKVTSYQLWTVDLESSGEPVLLTKGLPACVFGVAGGRTRADILALVAEGTETAVYRLQTEDHAFNKITHFPGDLGSLSVSADGQTLAVIGSVAERPHEVYAGNVGEGLQRVSNVHTWLDDVKLGEQEIVHWSRPDLDLDGLLIWPPGKSRADGPLPTIVSLHGGPYGRWANAFIVRQHGRWLAEHGYLVFLPNPRGGMGHGQDFAASVLHTVGNEDYLDIMAGVDMLVEQGLADGNRLGCGGWSQGGFMTAWIVGHTGRFKAGVMGAGVSDWGMMIATSDIPTYEAEMGGGNPFAGVGPHSFDRQSPISYVHQAQTPTLILHGEEDARVPVSQGIFFHRGLRAYNVPTELVTYPREPHGIQERLHVIDMLQRVRDWYLHWIPVQ